jgi:hypothetical protein
MLAGPEVERSRASSSTSGSARPFFLWSTVLIYVLYDSQHSTPMQSKSLSVKTSSLLHLLRLRRIPDKRCGEIPIRQSRRNKPWSVRRPLPSGAVRRERARDYRKDVSLRQACGSVARAALADQSTGAAFASGAVREAWAWRFHPAWSRQVTGRDPVQACEEARQRGQFEGKEFHETACPYRTVAA